jgi:hypothetical protein
MLFATCALTGGAARAEAPLVTAVYPLGVRFDLSNGRLLDPSDVDVVRGASMLERVDRPLVFRALKDEVVAFEVLVFGAGGTRKVSVVGLDPAIRAQVFFLRGIRVDKPSQATNAHTLGRGVYPDALIPTSTIAVPELPAVTMMLVDLFVTKAAKGGVHRGALAIEGATPIPIAIDVLDRSMPDRDVAKIEAVNFGSLLALEKRHPERYREWLQLAHAHHLTIEVMRIVPSFKLDGVVDWNRWASRVQPYVEGSAFTSSAGYVGPRAGRPITRLVTPLAEWWPMQPSEDGLMPSNEVRWTSALRQLEEVLLVRGWLSRDPGTEWIIFINGLDEPKTDAKLRALKAYGELIDRAKLIDRKHFTVRADGVFGARVPGWSDEKKLESLAHAVDLFNLHGATDTAPIGLLREHGSRAMFYASLSGGEPAIPPIFLDATVLGARAWGWIVVRYGLDGAMNWEIDLTEGCVENPRCSEGGALNLDALLVYRGHEVGRAQFEPIPSLRLKMLRQSAQDALLWSLVQEKDPKAARRFAEEVIPRALGDGVLANERGLWPRDPRKYEAIREAMLDRLVSEGRDRPDVRMAVWAVVLSSIAGIGIARWANVHARARRRR